MKNLFKIVTILSFVLITNLSLAQETDTLETKTYVYCQIIQSGSAKDNKIQVRVDYGQEIISKQYNLITSPNGRSPLKFNSMIDALNYMSEQGWEFVQAYVTIFDSGNGSTIHWILKKRKE